MGPIQVRLPTIARGVGAIAGKPSIDQNSGGQNRSPFGDSSGASRAKFSD